MDQIFITALLVLSIALFVLQFWNGPYPINLKSVRSPATGNEYYVRDKDNDSHAVVKLDQLHEILQKIRTQFQGYSADHPRFVEIQRFLNNSQRTILSETDSNFGDAGSTWDKGYRVEVCLRNVQDTTKFEDPDGTKFVFIHELAHIMTKSSGHTQEFYSNFKFLADESERLGILTKRDFTKAPIEYCGITVREKI